MKKPIANITNVFHIVNTVAVLVYISIFQTGIIFHIEIYIQNITCI